MSLLSVDISLLCLIIGLLLFRVGCVLDGVCVFIIGLRCWLIMWFICVLVMLLVYVWVYVACWFSCGLVRVYVVGVCVGVLFLIGVCAA